MRWGRLAVRVATLALAGALGVATPTFVATAAADSGSDVATTFDIRFHTIHECGLIQHPPTGAITFWVTIHGIPVDHLGLGPRLAEVKVTVPAVARNPRKAQTAEATTNVKTVSDTEVVDWDEVRVGGQPSVAELNRAREFKAFIAGLVADVWDVGPTLDLGRALDRELVEAVRRDCSTA